VWLFGCLVVWLLVVAVTVDVAVAVAVAVAFCRIMVLFVENCCGLVN
jgi:hypothetical protein